jgi:hypothetical protein
MTPAEQFKALLVESMRPACFADLQIEREPGDDPRLSFYSQGMFVCFKHDDCDRAIHKALSIVFGDEKVPCFDCWSSEWDAPDCVDCRTRVVLR